MQMQRDREIGIGFADRANKPLDRGRRGPGHRIRERDKLDRKAIILCDGNELGD
jgi:hypothetical protein